jgi:hypothetical protein
MGVVDAALLVFMWSVLRTYNHCRFQDVGPMTSTVVLYGKGCGGNKVTQDACLEFVRPVYHFGIEIVGSAAEGD